MLYKNNFCDIIKIWIKNSKKLKKTKEKYKIINKHQILKENILNFMMISNRPHMMFMIGKKAALKSCCFCFF